MLRHATQRKFNAPLAATTELASQAKESFAAHAGGEPPAPKAVSTNEAARHTPSDVSRLCHGRENPRGANPAAGVGADGKHREGVAGRGGQSQMMVHRVERSGCD
jgi:hypothetical protein